MRAAVVDPGLCTHCGACGENCRFDAIEDGRDAYQGSALRCEGCAVCTLVCPVAAVTMRPQRRAKSSLQRQNRGTGLQPRLVPGAGNSGLLVHAVKKTAMERDRNCDLPLIDGPPGTGCLLTSTISGVDAVLIITEPSVSGVITQWCREEKIPLISRIPFDRG